MTDAAAALTRPGHHRAGSARAALAHRDFRVLYAGQTVSSIGTWMQNIAVGPYALALTKTPSRPSGSASFVAQVGFAQMTPMLLLAIVGGALGNRMSRKALIIGGQGVQLISATALAVLAMTTPTKTGLLLCMLASGIAGALSMPTYQSVIPEVVGHDDLPGAISLNSASLNGSRVVGPLILLALAGVGVHTSTAHGMAVIFGVNALTFLASMAAVCSISIRPMPPRGPNETKGVAQLFDGFREARRNPVAGRILTILFFVSVFSLPYISHFPSIAERNLGFDSNSTTYKLLYGVWALGAMLGSLAQSTVLVGVDKRRIVRWMLAGLGGSLLVYATARSAVVAFPIVIVLGFFYFGSTTAMATVNQQHLGPQVRGPVMALWMMAFGGTIPFGAMWAGWVIDRWTPTSVLLIGGAVALALSTTADFVRRSERWHDARSDVSPTAVG